MARKPAASIERSVAMKPDEKRSYLVTEAAPSHVAGRRVKAGDELRLTEHEAQAELQQLHLRIKDTASKAD